MPVSLSGIQGHPFGNGSLCAAGLAAHHLAFHPLRVRTPLLRSHNHGVLESTAVSVDRAMETLGAALGPGKRVAVLDRRPGREISRRYRQWLGTIPDSQYLVAPYTEFGSLKAVGRCYEESAELGFDFEHASCIVSFGTPLFDSWGSPGRMMRLLEAKNHSGSPTLIQVEHCRSRSAMHADTWIPAFPGTETTFALSLLSVLLNSGLTNEAEKAAVRKVLFGNAVAEEISALKAFSPENVSAEIGISPDVINSVARTMASQKPTIVLAGGDAGAGPCERPLQAAVAAINMAMG